METGFLLPTFVVSNGTVTGIPWSNPNNFLLVDGDVSNSNTGAGIASDVTIGGYNISLPTDAVVDGIEIKVIGFQGAQTVPTLSLTLAAYDNNAGADVYYPYTAPFTGLGPTIGEYVLGSPTYLFATTWSIDQINNFKMNLTANGDISLDSVLINVHYHLTTPPIPPPPTPGVCIDCSSPIQVQAMFLELPFLSNQTKFYLKKGSFTYPNGIPVQPGDVGSCGGKIPFVFDEGFKKSDGQNFEENVEVDTNNGGTWTVLTNGVIEVDIGSVTHRGLDYKTPGTHVATNMSDHDANSKVIISNNAPYLLTLVRSCQVDTIFAPPIAVYDEGTLLTLSVHSFNFVGNVVAATQPTTHNITVTINAQPMIQFQNQGVNIGSPGDVHTINFVGAGVTAILGGFGLLTVNIPGGGSGGGHTIEVDGTPFAAESALNFVNFFIGTDVPGVSTNINLDTAAIANDNTFITTLISNTTFITAITNITGSGGAAKIDQTPDNGTYGLLAGAVNGSNTTYTVSVGAYVSGTLAVFLNGLIQLQGASDDWQETTPASGTFDFNVAPLAGDIITVLYQIPGVGNGSTSKIVHQVSHGFSADNVVRPSASDSVYVLSLMDTPAHAEVEGIVTLVLDADHFVLMTEGWYNMTALPAGAVAGSILFGSDTVPGAMTVTPPTTPPTVNKPIAQVDDASLKLIHFHNYRGQNNQTIPTATVSSKIFRYDTSADLPVGSGGTTFTKTFTPGFTPSLIMVTAYAGGQSVNNVGESQGSWNIGDGNNVVDRFTTGVNLSSNIFALNTLNNAYSISGILNNFTGTTFDLVVTRDGSLTQYARLIITCFA